MDDHGGEDTSTFSFGQTFGSFIAIIENYGWYILIASVILAFIYNSKLKRYVEKYKVYKFEREYAAKYHKNPDVFSAHITAQQKRTDKLQELYNNQAEKYQELQKEKEEKKKQELIEKYGGPAGNVLGGRAPQNTLRPESHPLMGSGSSSNYRPPRRSPCGGGGCGR